MSFRRLRHVDLLLPFARPPAEFAKDLLPPGSLPALSTLLARAGVSEKLTPEQDADADIVSRVLPHERWLFHTLLGGVSDVLTTNNSPAIATALMQACGLPTMPGYWFVVQPVHLHIARDHLVLTDTRPLAIGEQESRQLHELARQLAAEHGKDLLYGAPDLWFLRADDWQALHTATPDAAAGHNIDIWMPRGEGERAWRKLQNEVQMHWLQADLNREREARGLPPLNSLWLWGGAGPDLEAVSSASSHPLLYDRVFNLTDWTKALAEARVEQARADSAESIIKVEVPRALALLDHLVEPTLASDWGSWQSALHVLEQCWFAPLLSALESGRLSSLGLLLGDARQLTRLNITPWTLRRFWRRPSLAPLHP